MRKFDESKPDWVKEEQILNIDAETTNIIREEFRWWYGIKPATIITT